MRHREANRTEMQPLSPRRYLGGWGLRYRGALSQSRWLSASSLAGHEPRDRIGHLRVLALHHDNRLGPFFNNRFAQASKRQSRQTQPEITERDIEEARQDEQIDHNE